MSAVFHTPQSRCRAGVARCDITPPVGIYHRMWGAALHDRATGVHRPLTATALCLGAGYSYSPFDVILSLDHCILDGPNVRPHSPGGVIDTSVRGELCPGLLDAHARRRPDVHEPRAPAGGRADRAVSRRAGRKVRPAGREAWAKAQAATIVYGTGRCNLAAHRDFRDPITGQYRVRLQSGRHRRRYARSWPGSPRTTA